MNQILIQAAKEQDFEGIWQIFRNIIVKGDTYANGPKTTRDQAYEKWADKNAKVFIAKNNDKIIGAYLIKNNQVELGSHVANCSYIVDENARGTGLGKALGLHSIEVAKDLKYKGIQFNFVVSTNKVAVNLWQSLGFKIIGIIPNGFDHKILGFVDAYIMFKELS